MEVTITKEKNKSFSFQAHGHDTRITIPIIGSELLEKGNKGLRPMEAFLTALGSCMTIDILYILEKQRQVVREYSCLIKGDRVKTIPSVFKSIQMYITLEGDIKDKKIEEAISLSKTRYCSVFQMIDKSISFNISYTLNKRSHE